jgi:SAM-dependent methyltransferase
MLAVARQKTADVEWKHGFSEALPFDRETFDAVVSQFALMYFEDRLAAIREMVRVLRPGGRLVVAVWASLDRTPGYAALAGLLERLIGAQAADAVKAPFVMGDPDQLGRLFAEAGLPEVQISTPQGTARFPSLEAWMFTEIRGWTLADQIDDDQFNRLLAEARTSLQPFVTADGRVEFASPANIVTAVKPL